MLPLLVGIASSLVATAIFLSASEFVRRVVIPWYADKIYRGVRVDGHWEADSIDGIKIEDLSIAMNLDLTQRGDIVNGTYSHRDKNGDVDIYTVTGRLRDRYLFVTSIPISNRRIDGGTMVFYMHNINSKLSFSGSILFCKDPGQVDILPKIVFSWHKP